MHFVDDLRFETRCETGRAIIINHRPATFITALFQDALGWDVTGRTVCVGMHEEPCAVVPLI